MRLAIVRIADRGVPNQERLHLQVQAPANLAYYVVLDNVYLNPSGLSWGSKTAFWFPSQPVNPGDDVVLITGSGQPTQAPNERGGTTYFYYWNQPNTLWNTPQACAVLMELGSWQTSTYGL